MLIRITAISTAVMFALAAYAYGIQSTGNASKCIEFLPVVFTAGISGLVAAIGLSLSAVKYFAQEK